MEARARVNEINGVRSMYKTDRSMMNLAARDYSTFIKEPFIICVKYSTFLKKKSEKFGSKIITSVSKKLGQSTVYVLLLRLVPFFFETDIIGSL